MDSKSHSKDPCRQADHFNLCRFEKALKDKLIQKSNAKQSEEATLMKMFKFFDVNGLGRVDFQTFARVCDKMGMYYPEEQLQPLFNSYDKDGSGEVDYQEFALALFGSEAAAKATLQKRPKVEPQT